MTGVGLSAAATTTSTAKNKAGVRTILHGNRGIHFHRAHWMLIRTGDRGRWVEGRILRVRMRIKERQV